MVYFQGDKAQIKSILGLILLIVAAFAGNLFSVSLFPGVDFIFGSIAVLIVLVIYGAGWGLATVIFSGSYTLFLWHQPYAYFLFIVELLFVGVFYKGRRINLMYSDGLFWFVLGLPVGWVFYHYLLHMDGALAALIILKLTVNGIFNALLASIAISLLNFRKAQGFTKDTVVNSLYNSLFNIMVGFILIPSILIIFAQSRYETDKMKADITENLKYQTEQISNQLLFWQKEHMNAVTELATIAAEHDLKPSEYLQSTTEHFKRIFPDFVGMLVCNQSGTSIAYYPPVEASGESTVGQDFSDRDYFIDARKTLTPQVSPVFMGRAGTPFPLIVLTVPIVSPNKEFRGIASAGLNLKYFSQILKLSPHNEDVLVTVLDRKGQVIHTNRKDLKTLEQFPNDRGGQRKGVDRNIYLWTPESYKHEHSAVQWGNSFLVGETQLSDDIPWTIIVENPLANYQKAQQQIYFGNLLTVLVLILMAFLLSAILSRRLTRPLTELAAVTTNLPDELQDLQHLAWPQSSVLEIDSLVSNFKTMAGTLQNNFQQLQNQYAFLQLLIDTMPSPVFYKDVNGVYLGCNRAFEKYIGLHKNAIVGRTVYDIYEKKFADVYGQADEKALQSADNQTYEASLRYADGTQHSVIFNKARFMNTDDSLGGLVGVFLDITDLKEAEKVLKEQQVQLQVQFEFANALNRMAEAIINDDDAQSILETMCRIVGETLNVDRCLIFDVHYGISKLISLCIWENAEICGAEPENIYSVGFFSNSLQYIRETRHWLESHTNAVNPYFLQDKGAEILHRKMKIQSLLWYPFSFHEKGFYILSFNQTSHLRHWRNEEIEFIMAVAKQVEIALQKIRYLAERKVVMESLQSQSAAINASMDGIAIVDAEGRLAHVNEAYARIYGFNQTEALIGKSWTELFCEAEAARIQKDIFPIVWKDGQWRGEATGQKKDGCEFALEMSLTLINEGSQVCIVRDITERQQVQKLIWEEKERAQVTLQSIGDAVITTDSFGNVTYLNTVAENLTGWKTHEAKGLQLQKVFNIINELTGEEAENPVIRCLNESRIVGLANHTELIHREGHRYAIEDSAAPITNSDGEIIGVVLVFHDVSEKRNLLQQMTHLAYHDPLTELPNRVLFHDRLTLALARASRNKEMLAVLFLDLDRFKMVNDMLGHGMGDWLLKEVAVRLVKCLRESDTIARLGGDEFTLVIPQISQSEDVAKIARKALDSLQKPFSIKGHEFYISGSVGIAMYPQDGEDAETLMRHADTAMYRAKEKGLNNYQFYTSSMNAKIVERLAMENNIRHSLERMEFLVYYQPQVNVTTGLITGMEALVRWNHPTWGLISPTEFIPVAEDTGLIVPIGEWVLRTACARNKAWQDAGYSPMRVTVNLSGIQFKQFDLMETISRVLLETGLDPSLLELEITETVAMQDVGYTIEVLQKLKGMGVQFAIDDFGTGYSSLSYLKKFPINTLKIDRSFVRDIVENQEDATIVTTIIAMARSLRLKVIAEGVETMEQLNFLKELQCEEMQGYLFSQPVPYNLFEELLKSEQCF